MCCVIALKMICSVARLAGLSFSRSSFRFFFPAHLPPVSAQEELGSARYSGLALPLSNLQPLIHLPAYALVASHFPLLCLCRSVMGLEVSGFPQAQLEGDQGLGRGGKGAVLCMLAAFGPSWC